MWRVLVLWAEFKQGCGAAMEEREEDGSRRSSVITELVEGRRVVVNTCEDDHHNW